MASKKNKYKLYLKRFLIFLVIAFILFLIVDYNLLRPSFMIKINHTKLFLMMLDSGKVDRFPVHSEDFETALRNKNSVIAKALIVLCRDNYWFDSYSTMKSVMELGDGEVIREYFSVFEQDDDGYIKGDGIESVFLSCNTEHISLILEAGADPDSSLYIDTDKEYIERAYKVKMWTEYKWSHEYIYTAQGYRPAFVYKPHLQIDFEDVEIPVWMSDEEIMRTTSGVSYQMDTITRQTFPVLLAAESGEYETVRLLVEYGCDTSVIGSNGETLQTLINDDDLMYEIKSFGKNLDRIDQLIVRDDLDAYISHLETLSDSGIPNYAEHLRTAVKYGSYRISTYLLADMQIPVNRDDYHLLIDAYESRSSYVLDLLLSRGVDPFNQTLLKNFPVRFHPPEDNVATILASFLSSGPMQTREEKLDSTVTVGRELIGTARVERQWANLFILSGHMYEWNPFFIALFNHSLEEAEAMVHENPDVLNSLDNQGQSALAVACFYGQYETAKYLINLGINPDASDKDSVPPIIRCIQIGHLELVKLLVRNGAAIFDNKDKTESTVLAYAKRVLENQLGMDRIFGAYKKFRGGEGQMDLFRYREVYDFLETEIRISLDEQD